MEQLFDAQLLEKAGMAVVALASIWVNYRLVSSFNKTLNNHINHSTESNINLTNAVGKLIIFLEKKLK